MLMTWGTGMRMNLIKKQVQSILMMVNNNDNSVTWGIFFLFFFQSELSPDVVKGKNCFYM